MVGRKDSHLFVIRLATPDQLGYFRQMAFDLSSIEDVRTLSETDEIECKLAAGRDGRGELPKDLWETYSAFANTRGGVIVLGIRDSGDNFKIEGIANVDKLRRDFFNQANNPQKISVCIVTDDDFYEFEIAGKRLCSIRVRAAGRQERPVYINGNNKNTYKRLNDGDRLCDDEEVRRMIAERIEDSRDSRILSGFDVSDLNAESIALYRRSLRDRSSAHPFLEREGVEFLRCLKAWSRDRDSGREGITVAGLLMFGTSESIRDEFPNYAVDFQERPDSRSELRWIDRVTTDGTWSGNLFDFYRLVFRKITSELKVPFQIRHGTRTDETSAHVALREALVNCLVHADYSGRASILIVKRHDMFGFRNPGLMRVSVEQAKQGGESDCRNRSIQQMFLIIGAAERAGSGVPKIFKGWSDQHWRPPALYEDREPSEQTLLELRMASLLPDEVVAELRERFTGTFEELSANERLILAAAASEESVTHARAMSFCNLHPADMTRLLQGLVARGYLDSKGRTRATVYRLPVSDTKRSDEDGRANLASGAAAQSGSLGTQSGRLPDQSGEPEAQAGNPSDPRFSMPDRIVVENLKDLDETIRADLVSTADRLRGRGKVKPELMKAVILDLCVTNYLTPKVIATLVGRSDQYIREQYIAALIEDGKLERAYPEPNDPRQAYLTRAKAST